MNPPIIFIWEPQSIIAFDLKTMFTKAGFRVSVLRTIEGIEERLSKENPHVFILCPDLDFDKSSIIISALNTFKVPVIVLSSMSKNIIEKTLNIVTSQFLLKPFERKELIKCVLICLNKNGLEMPKECTFNNFRYMNNISEKYLFNS